MAAPQRSQHFSSPETGGEILITPEDGGTYALRVLPTIDHSDSTTLLSAPVAMRCFPRHDYAVSVYGFEAYSRERWEAHMSHMAVLLECAKTAEAGRTTPDAVKPVPEPYKGQRIPFTADLPSELVEALERMFNRHPDISPREFVAEAMRDKLEKEADVRN